MIFENKTTTAVRRRIRIKKANLQTSKHILHWQRKKVEQITTTIKKKAIRRHWECELLVAYFIVSCTCRLSCIRHNKHSFSSNFTRTHTEEEKKYSNRLCTLYTYSKAYMYKYKYMTEKKYAKICIAQTQSACVYVCTVNLCMLFE